MLCCRSGGDAAMAAAAIGFRLPRQWASSPRLAPQTRRQRRWCSAAMDQPETEPKKKTATVRSKAGDELEVCRVVNGMWQVSGASWGRAAPAAAVDAMLRYADGGLATFDMADICKPSALD